MYDHIIKGFHINKRGYAHYTTSEAKNLEHSRLMVASSGYPI